jgi:type VI secretion system protein ImpG
MMLTFVDACFDPASPAARTLTAELLCTNRHLAHTLEPGTLLAFEQPGPVASVRIAHRPTRQSFAALDGSSRWRLASQFVLNHTPLVSGPQALQSLREMLELHNLATNPSARRQVSGLMSVSSEAIVGHVGADLWRGWQNGLNSTTRISSAPVRSCSPACWPTSSRCMRVSIVSCIPR